MEHKEQGQETEDFKKESESGSNIMETIMSWQSLSEALDLKNVEV